MRLPALHSGGQVPAIDSDPYLSPLPASGWVAHSAAGLLWACLDRRAQCRPVPHPLGGAARLQPKEMSYSLTAVRTTSAIVRQFGDGSWLRQAGSRLRPTLPCPWLPPPRAAADAAVRDRLPATHRSAPGDPSGRAASIFGANAVTACLAPLKLTWRGSMPFSAAATAITSGAGCTPTSGSRSPSQPSQATCTASTSICITSLIERKSSSVCQS